MKRIYLFAFFVMICSAVFAQKYLPVIQPGTILTYDVVSKASGQHAAVSLTIISLKAPVKMKWEIWGGGGDSGFFEMTEKSLESAKKTVAKEPESGETTTTKDDETLAIVSKATFSDLIKNRTFELNGVQFMVHPDNGGYKINDKEADVFHATSKNGKKEIWILNNPNFPLICKAKGITGGLNFSLVAIK